MHIPYTALSKETLRAIIEQFVLSEGTDYGAHEVSLERKVEQVYQQLVQGTATVNYDPESESCFITSVL